MRPLHVLMTCDGLGGIWRYAVDLADALGSTGVEVTLVGSGPRPDAEPAAALAGRLYWLDHPPTWLAESPARIRALADAIARLQRRLKADIVHLNQPAEAAFLEVEVPVVVAAHSCLTTWWRSVYGSDPPFDWRWRAGLEADGFRRADAVAAPTVAHAMAVQAAHGIPMPAIVPNASRAPLSRRTARKPAVVAAARWWDAGKNLGVLDQAAGASRWPILLFGRLNGPDGSRVTPRHATPLGARPADEVHRAMSRAALFVSPSLYEPFGLAALEAARSGAAMLLADLPTYRELWDDAASFFDPRSPAALATALDALSRDDSERARLAAASAARAAGFTPEAQVAALRRVYAAAGAPPVPALEAVS